MLDPTALEQIAKELSSLLPPPIANMRAEVEKNMRGVLQSALSKMDLVSREEFDVQKEVLLRSRLKIEALEKRLTELEA